MAAIVWTDVTGAFAGLSAVASSWQTLTLAHVNGTGIAVTKFDGESGTLTKTARIALAAHYGALSLRNVGGAGSVTMMSEGGVSIQFSQPTSKSDPIFGSTPGGVMFLSLIYRAPRLRGPILA